MPTQPSIKPKDRRADADCAGATWAGVACAGLRCAPGVRTSSMVALTTTYGGRRVVVLWRSDGSPSILRRTVTVAEVAARSRIGPERRAADWRAAAIPRPATTAKEATAAQPMVFRRWVGLLRRRRPRVMARINARVDRTAAVRGGWPTRTAAVSQPAAAGISRRASSGSGPPGSEAPGSVMLGGGSGGLVGSDADMGFEGVELLRAYAGDLLELVDGGERAVLGAEVEDALGQDGAYAREGIELVEGGGVEVDGGVACCARGG